MTDEINNDNAAKEQHFSDAFDGKVLHPVIDYADGMVILGFSYANASFDNKAVFLVATGGSVQVIRADSFEVNGQKYFIDRKRAKKLRL